MILVFRSLQGRRKWVAGGGRFGERGDGGMAGVVCLVSFLCSRFWWAKTVLCIFNIGFRQQQLDGNTIECGNLFSEAAARWQPCVSQTSQRIQWRKVRRETINSIMSKVSSSHFRNHHAPQSPIHAYHAHKHPPIPPPKKTFHFPYPIPKYPILFPFQSINQSSPVKSKTSMSLSRHALLLEPLPC